MAKQVQKYDLAHQQVLAAIFGQTRLDKYPCMTEEVKLTSYATPWAKQFQDDINSLKELEGSDDFVCELKGGLREVFWLYGDEFCAIDLNVIRANYWSTSCPRLGRGRDER